MCSVIRRTLANVFGSALMLALIETSVLGSGSTPSVSLTLAWDPSADTSVAGYRLYEGAESQVYTNVLDIGGATAATVQSLIPGTTYYFAVTAYDDTGLESAFSGEISYTVPTSAPQPPMLQVGVSIAQQTGNEVILTGNAPVGTVCQILATEDFVEWLAVGTVTPDATGSFQLTDTAGALLNQRFYRLVVGAQPATPRTISGPSKTAAGQTKSL